MPHRGGDNDTRFSIRTSCKTNANVNFLGTASMSSSRRSLGACDRIICTNIKTLHSRSTRIYHFYCETTLNLQLDDSFYFRFRIAIQRKTSGKQKKRLLFSKIPYSFLWIIFTSVGNCELRCPTLTNLEKLSFQSDLYKTHFTQALSGRVSKKKIDIKIEQGAWTTL